MATKRFAASRLPAELPREPARAASRPARAEVRTASADSSSTPLAVVCTACQGAPAPCPTCAAAAGSVGLIHTGRPPGALPDAVAPLALGPVGDPAEREAERVARRVPFMAIPRPLRAAVLDRILARARCMREGADEVAAAALRVEHTQLEAGRAIAREGHFLAELPGTAGYGWKITASGQVTRCSAPCMFLRGLFAEQLARHPELEAKLAGLEAQARAAAAAGDAAKGRQVLDESVRHGERSEAGRPPVGVGRGRAAAVAQGPLAACRTLPEGPEIEQFLAISGDATQNAAPSVGARGVDFA